VKGVAFNAADQCSYVKDRKLEGIDRGAPSLAAIFHIERDVSSGEINGAGNVVTQQSSHDVIE